MRKNYFLLIMFLSGLFHPTAAQVLVPNAGFENILSGGEIANWGNVYLVPVSIDTNGNSTFDTIIYDNGWFYQPSSDTHSGSTAMELRNALDLTTNQTICGAVTADADSQFTAWGLSEHFPIQGEPIDFRFYYKFNAVNNDTAYASVLVTDSMNNTVAFVELDLPPASVYTYMYSPVTCTAGFTPAFMSIVFSNAKTGGQCSFGSRLLIDDVEVDYNISATGLNEIQKPEIICSPNPVKDILNIECRNFKAETLNIYDLNGQLLIQKESDFSRIDLSALTQGSYLLEVKGGNSTVKKTIIRN